jgi:hypothetical protein
MSPREARAVVRRLAEYEKPSRKSQILALLTILRDELQSDWSYRAISSVLIMTKRIVSRIRSDAMREMKYETGRPP